MTLFKFGRVVATPGALALLDDVDTHEATISVLMNRHTSGDWGDVDAEDWNTNDHSVEVGSRILSAYKVRGEETVWIITEADRSYTTILLPEEY